MKTKTLIGGIGDFMLSIDSMKDWSDEGNDILFITHQSKKTILELAELFNLRVSDIITFNTVDEIVEKINANKYETFPAKTFSKQMLGSGGLWQGNDDFRIALHPKGSGYARDYLEKSDHAPKDLPTHMVEFLINSLYAKHQTPIALIMSPEEWDGFDKNALTNVQGKFFRIDNIKTAVRASATCDVLVGSDSGMKSISSVFKRNTVVMIPQMTDLIRDNVFLIPYVKAGTMRVFQYTKENYNSREDMINLAIAVTGAVNKL